MLNKWRQRRLVCNGRQTRNMSFLGTIFGMGEFEKPKNLAYQGSNIMTSYEFALLDYVSMNSHPTSSFKDKMPQEDPAFVMGHVLLGTSQCLNPMSHQDSLDAFQHATKASEMVQAGGLKEKEKLHVAALHAMVKGRLLQAAAIYETILLQDPTDLLAIRSCYDIYLVLGDYRNLLGTVTRRLPMWSPQLPGYSHLLGMQAFGLCVQGQLDAAESIAERALSMNELDKWAFCAMLHVYQGRGNPNYGASYALQHQEFFESSGPLKRHLYYLWTLYLIELGRFERIDKFLELHILPLNSQGIHSINTLKDTTQILWRLHFAGQDITELLSILHSHWTKVDKDLPTIYHSPLIQVLRHSVQAYATGKDHSTKVASRQETEVDIAEFSKALGVDLVQFSYASPTAQVNKVVQSVNDAFTAYAQGRYNDATKLLLPVRGSLNLLGGSHVEHDVIELLLIESASRSKDLSLAKLLLNERLSAKPQSAQCWQTYSRVFESLGDSIGFRDAQSMSYVLGLGQGGNNTN